MSRGRRDEAPGTETVLVVAAVIRRGDAFLLARRPSDGRHPGLWEFPGGKVDDGESEADALARELEEELAVSLLEMGEPLFETLDPGSPFLVRFRPAEILGEPRALEHPEIRWVSRSRLAVLELAPSDARFVEGRLLGSG